MLPFEIDASQVGQTARARMEQRTTAEAKALIERAARSIGLSASDFTVAAACRAARETLYHHEMTRIAEVDHAAFMRAFEATEPTAALVDLMRLHKEISRPDGS